MYYVDKYVYLGNDENYHENFDHFVITKNLINDNYLPYVSRDWGVYQDAVFKTEKEARAYILDNYEVNQTDVEPVNGIVDIFRCGKYAQMDLEESANWAYDLYSKDITKDTTDAQIAELFREYEVEANENGGTLDTDLIDAMKDYRNELIKDNNDE